MTKHSDRVDPNRTLAVLAVGALAYAVLSAAVLPALPLLQRDLHTSETGATWVLTAYLLAAALGTSILGRLGDMHGKTRVLIWTFVILAAATLLAALATSMAVLLVGRALQGAAGGIFPLSFGIVRDEFPREKVAGGIGLLSATLGIGAGLGIIGCGLVVEHLSWHWLFWLPLIVIVAAGLCLWRVVPESPVRVPGRINWVAAILMTIGISALLLAVSESTVWGWGSVKTLSLLALGLLVTALWVWFETRSEVPLVDMTMTRIRGVWTTNAAAFMLGAGMYLSFIIIPQFAQVPTSKGFGFGASVVQAGLYLVPLTTAMMLMSLLAGPLAARFGSRWSLLAGCAFTAAAFVFLTVAHGHRYQLLISSAIIGVGIGLSFSALGNLIIEAVPVYQTGVASGMNTVMRTLGGALGAQLAATFIADNTLHALPTVKGFTESFALAAAFVLVSLAVALLVPDPPERRRRRSHAAPAPPGLRDRNGGADSFPRGLQRRRS